MRRSYGAGDNASMESFFALLQENVLNTRGWERRQELRLAIVTLDRHEVGTDADANAASDGSLPSSWR